LLLLTMGCGPDPTVLPFSRWGTELAAAECARVFSCCDAAEQMLWSYTDEAQCRQTVASQAQSSIDGLLSAGWISYDGKMARRCVDEIASLACTDLLVLGKGLVAPSCTNITRGTGKIGTTCEDLDVICESSNCIGTCGPTRGCNAVCRVNEYCDVAAQVCAPFKTAGAPCAGNGECAFPLSCQAGVCAALLPGGAACASMSDCASASCAGNTCDPQMCDGA
jgi:hypothetical protein